MESQTFFVTRLLLAGPAQTLRSSELSYVDLHLFFCVMSDQWPDLVLTSLVKLCQWRTQRGTLSFLSSVQRPEPLSAASAGASEGLGSLLGSETSSRKTPFSPCETDSGSGYGVPDDLRSRPRYQPSD